MSFKDLTTLRVGGEIKGVFYPKDLYELIDFIKENKSALVVGNGSNILASDSFYDEMVIKLDKMQKVIRHNDDFLIVSANVMGSELVAFLREEDIGGMEFLATIPGTIGGMIAMNAGCYKQTVSDFFYKGVFLDRNGNLQILKYNDLEFEYRNSYVKKEGLICLYVLFEAPNIPFDLEKLRRLQKHRKDTQPSGNSAGSVFVNPSSELSAWQLIEEIGLRGYKLGNALISHKHSNFILNDGDSDAQDIYNLINMIQEMVLTRKNVVLRSELIIINF